MAIVVAMQDAPAVQMRANAAISTPNPASAAMQFVAVMISAPQMPVTSNSVPPCPSPSVKDTQSVQMIANPFVFSPTPLRPSVIVVASPQVPVRPDTAPMTLIIPLQSSETVPVDTDSSESPPHPAMTSMQVMIIVVFPVQVPVAAHMHPARASPSTLYAQSV